MIGNIKIKTAKTRRRKVSLDSYMSAFERIGLSISQRLRASAVETGLKGIVIGNIKIQTAKTLRRKGSLDINECVY